MTTLPRHLLPASLLRIAEQCGDDVMWALWERFPGVHVYVPREAAGHPLQAVLGANLFRLARAFGGEILEIHKAAAARRAVRDALIRRDRERGDDHAAIALRYQLTERQVRTILSVQARLNRQLDVWGEHG